MSDKGNPLYRLGYANGYAARGRRFQDINSAEVAQRVQAIFASTGPAKVQANFDFPSGRRLTLLMPHDMTVDDLAFFREVVEPYLDLLAKRLAEQAAQPAQAGADRAGG